MKLHLTTFLCFLLTINLFPQDFNPDDGLTGLSGNKENIGITAGYSIDGEIKWTGSAGFACADSGTPFSAKTLTRIASIAKNFTAVAVMQLVEQGQIELKAPVGKYLPALPEDKRQLTVQQLLAHTAGISQYQGEKEIENTVHYPTLQESVAVFIDRSLMFEPGTKYFYTTYGYVLLGRIIEEVSGMRYEQYMQKNIFDIAGMHNTGVEIISEHYPGKSCLYHNNGRKAKAGKQNDLSNRIPGGGFYSTLEDVLKFGNALLEGKFISSETLDKMTQYEAVEYDGNKYGLGFYLYGPPPNENVVIGHGGGQTGCTSQLMMVPKTKTVVVVLSNTSGTYPDIATFASNLIGYSESKK